MLDGGVLRRCASIWSGQPARLRRFLLPSAIVLVAVLAAAIWAVPPSVGQRSGQAIGARAGAEKMGISMSGAHAPLSVQSAVPSYGPVDGTGTVHATADVVQGRQIVRQATLDIAVRSVHQSYADILDLVRGEGGYALQTNLANSGAQSSASLQVAVPVSGLTGFLAAVARLGNVQNEGLSGNDVTSRVVDVQAQLTVLNAEVSQLLDLMRRAGSVQAMLQVEQQLVQTRTQIEELQSEQAALSQQVALATVQIALEPLGPRLSPAGTTFSAQVRRVFFAAASALVYVLGRLLLALVWLLPFAALAAAAFGAWRTYRSRRKRRMQAP